MNPPEKGSGDDGCYISADHIRTLIDPEDSKKKLKDEVLQFLAAGCQVLAEDLFSCALEVANKAGRTEVTPADVNSCIANVLFRY